MMSLTLRKVLAAASIAFWGSTLGVTSRVARADDAEPADSLFAPFPNSSGSMRTISLSRESDPNNPLGPSFAISPRAHHISTTVQRRR